MTKQTVQHILFPSPAVFFLFICLGLSLLFSLLSLVSCGEESSEETTSQMALVVHETPGPEPTPFIDCSDARDSAPLRISDGMLFYSADGSPGKTPLLLGGSGSYELATDPLIIDSLLKRHGQETNVFDSILKTSPEQSVPRLNFFRLWVPGFSTAAVEWGAASFSEREEMPYEQISEQLWDLESFDTEAIEQGPSARFFSRLKRILDDSLEAGVIVQITLFDHCMMKWLDITDPLTGNIISYRFWQHNPWNPKNNINDLYGELPTDYPPFPNFYLTVDSGLSNFNPRLRELQKHYVETMVHFTASYPNVCYEIMNQADNASGRILAQWHMEVIRWIRAIAPEKLVAISSFPLIRHLENAAKYGTGDSDTLELLTAVDIYCYHYSNLSWASDYFTCEADIETVKADHDTWFGGKISLFDTDGAGGIGAPCRELNENVADWASRVFNLGASFNHKDYIFADPDTADESCAESGCGFRFDCVVCGIDSIDLEANTVIADALAAHIATNQLFFDARLTAAEEQESDIYIEGLNSGTLPIPTNAAIFDYCNKLIVGDILSGPVSPGDGFTLDVSGLPPGDYSFRMALPGEADNDEARPFGTVINVRKND